MKIYQKTRGGWGRNAPFPKSRASYFRFARFNTSPLYYLRAWHWLCFDRKRLHIWVTEQTPSVWVTGDYSFQVTKLGIFQRFVLFLNSAPASILPNCFLRGWFEWMLFVFQYKRGVKIARYWVSPFLHEANSRPSWPNLVNKRFISWTKIELFLAGPTQEIPSGLG